MCASAVFAAKCSRFLRFNPICRELEGTLKMLPGEIACNSGGNKDHRAWPLSLKMSIFTDAPGKSQTPCEASAALIFCESSSMVKGFWIKSRQPRSMISRALLSRV